MAGSRSERQVILPMRRTKERTAARLRRACVRLCAAALVTSTLTGAATAFPATVTAQDGLRLRSAANTTSKSITTLPSGSRIEVLEAVGDSWYRVQAEQQTGYVSSKYVSALPETPTNSTPAQQPQPQVPAFGTVSASTLNVRSGPGTSFDKVATLSSGAPVEIIEELDEWYHIQSDPITGYVSKEYITVEQSAQNSQPSTPPEQAQPDTPSEQPEQDKKTYGLVSASTLNVRSGPDASHEKVGTLSSGAQVEILETLDGWYRIEGGYVSADYIQILDDSMTALQAQIVAYARTFLGCAYVYGGNGPTSFDCSGLTKYIYKHFGYTINRTATQQLKNGVPVSKENLQPGDLVFFNSEGTGVNRATHVGIYIGDGNFLHASNKRVGVTITSLSDAYRVRTYTTARRII